MRLWSLLLFSSFQQGSEGQAVLNIFDDTVEDLVTVFYNHCIKEFIAAWIEVLTLTKYFYGDTVSAGNQEGIIRAEITFIQRHIYLL